MPYARKNTIIWQQGMYYHIYNRGARQVTIFREETNYLFTISKRKESSRAKRIMVLTYCLMPNHFHFLVRQDGEAPAGDLPQFIFNSYSKAHNKMYSRIRFSVCAGQFSGIQRPLKQAAERRLLPCTWRTPPQWFGAGECRCDITWFFPNARPVTSQNLLIAQVGVGHKQPREVHKAI